MANPHRPDNAAERDAARRERFKTARSAVPTDQRPLFAPPIQVSTNANSALSQNISSVLGSFDNYARQIVYSRSCIGVSDLPLTPGVNGPAKVPFPPAPAVTGSSSNPESNQRHNNHKPKPPPPNPANHRPGVFETISKDKTSSSRAPPASSRAPAPSSSSSSSSSVAATTPDKHRPANRSSQPTQDKSRQQQQQQRGGPPEPSPQKAPEHFDRLSTHVSKRLFDDNKRELLKLNMPKKKEGGRDDLLDNILQEMTLSPPLTAIHTPKKDEQPPKFPFPEHKPSPLKTSSSSSSLKQSTTHKVKRNSSNPASAPKKPAEVTGVTPDGQRDNNALSDSDSDSHPDEEIAAKPPPSKQPPKPQLHVATDEKPKHAVSSCTAAVKPPSRRQSRMSLSSIQLSDSSESSSSDTSSDEEEEDEKRSKVLPHQPPQVEEPDDEEEDVDVEMEEDVKVDVVEPETPPEEKSEKRWNLQSFIQVQAPSSNSPPSSSSSDQAAPPEPPSPPAPAPPSADSPAAKKPVTVAAAVAPPSGEIDNMSIINDIIHGDSLALDSFDEEIEIDKSLFDADSVRLDTVAACKDPVQPLPAKKPTRTPLPKSPARVPKIVTDVKKKLPGRGRPPGSKNKKSNSVAPPAQSKAIKQPRAKHASPKSSSRPPPSSSSSSSSSSSDSSDDERFRPVPKLPSSSGIMDLTADAKPVIAAAPKAKKPAKVPKTKVAAPPPATTPAPPPPKRSSSTQLESLSEVLTRVSAPVLLSPIPSHGNLAPPLLEAKREVKPVVAAEVSRGITYVDGKPSIMVRLDLSLLGKLAAKVKQRSVALPDLVPSSPALRTDPLTPIDDPVINSPVPSPAAMIKVTPYRESSIEEGEDLSSSSSSSSSSSEDEMDVEDKPSTPLANSSSSNVVQEPPDKEAISRSEKRLKNEQILSQIMDSGQQRQQPPKQVKIPKRSRNDLEHSLTSKRAKRSRTDQHGHKRYRSNSNDRESHEDDRKWDRKHQWRSSTVDDDRWSVTSASSHHSDHQEDSRHRNRDHDRVRDRRDSHDRKDSRDRLHVVDWDAPPASSECVRSSSANTTPTHSRNSVAKDWGAMVSMDTPLLSSNAGTPHSHRTTEDLPLERRRESVSMQKHRVAPAVDESLKSSDFYVQEARRLKHLADASMPDKFSKSLMYVESVLSFIQYGTAMEYEHKDPNKIFKVYFDTLNFCRYICNSKSSTLSNCEKKLSVLSLRLQAFLCLKMFKTKKTEAAKLKRVLDDHNKATTSKQAPSPFQPNGQWSRSNGTPSPMSPQPSPAGSTASMGSVVSPPSCYGESAKQSSSASSTASAQRIQSVTAQYLQHVRYLSDCHEIWEQTDAAMLDHKDFFRNLDNDCGRLTMQSSVPEIVRYIKVGLHRLKEVS